MKNNALFFALLFLLFSMHGHAQQDTLQIISVDSVFTPAKKHSAQTATIFSAIVPGLGQVYNQNYWKVPVIYAGFAGFAYVAAKNHGFYSEFKKEYDSYQTYTTTQIAAGKIPQTDTLLLVGKEKVMYSPYSVKDGRDYYRRRRDLALIGAGAWYFLNIIEAYVSAHTFSFDISDNLILNYMPLHFNSTVLYPTGIKFTLSF